MERSFKQYILAGTILAGGAAFAGATPAFASVTTGACPAVGYASLGCDLIITLNPGGTATVTDGPSHGLAGGTYDGVDDTLIGIVNDSGASVGSVHLTAKTDIFGFDGDGIEDNPNSTSGLPGLAIPGATGFACGGTTAHQQGYCGTDSTNGNFNLSGPLNSYSGITAAFDAGNVNFPGGLAAGASAFFSLEEALTSASFTSITPTPTPSAPEPATLSILGAALAGFGLMRRRKQVT